VLGHGAGGGQRTPFMAAAAHALATRGIDVVTFNFPYIEQGRRLPDRRPVLEACYRDVIAHVRRERDVPSTRLFIGGKSMGGRMATHVAAATDATDHVAPAGLVLLGYPLHPPGKPHELRDVHFPFIRCPVLFVQGSRDTFGTPAELTTSVAKLQVRHDLHVVDGGDHSFKISGASRGAASGPMDGIYQRIVGWIGEISR
jgi:predicted alpha/beta-hydrolase family hydrolase